MTKWKLALTPALLALSFTPLPAAAHPPIPERGDNAEQAALQADRADILAMAGNYKVRFDMQESTPWTDDYLPLDRKISGGHESVRVIEDSGTKIVLQHLLVVTTKEGESFIVKHWRQDWQYEPETVLVYSDTGEWVAEAVDPKRAHGRWSQTVYQVDDSPRYAGIGEWETQGGVRRWRSNWTWRPLARRDAVRHPVYDRYYAINRHSPTPNGWIHFQDNTKMANVDGKLVPIVQEYVLNSYTRFDDYDVGAADAYWADTKGYWAAVRAAWDALLQREGAIRVTEEAETGTVISARLLEMGTEIHKGELAEADAIAEARRLIDGSSTRLATASKQAEDY
ncbi:MAG: DUF6607 family protein [Blastomonas sp.]